uniref:Intercellular adhesion molecule N-terminal domain-containing protein n=1 Tax=Echeneis naucrates TaxID=173247 RepID=A0A665UHM5_ECHNA
MLVFCFFKGKQVLKLNCFGFKVSAAAQIEILSVFIIQSLCPVGKPVSANPNCTTELSPPHIVVPYGGSFSVNCSTSPTLTEGMGWEASQDGIPLKDGVSFLSLTVSNVTDWKISAQCFSNLKDGEQCVKKLPIAVYKMPDHVSMSLPSLMGPMVEDEEYRLKCGIVNVAPARNVYVRWYKGSQLIQETSNDTSLLPVNMSFDFDLRAQSGDDGTQIWCEASLQFFAPGPKFPPMRSESHELIVLLYLSYSGAHYDLAQKKSFSNFLMLLFSVR